MPAWPEREVRELIARALEEDVGPGDITTQACVPESARARGRFLARREVVLAGLDLLPLVYGIQHQARFADGDRVAAGEVIATISGPARLLLERERVALNFLQRLSGIATHTRRFVDAVAGTGVKILDTRKTTPGWRALEKRAVAAGGGVNHRMGLYDAVLIKENHAATAGGIRAAIEAVQRAGRAAGKVEVEVRNGAELREALEAGARRVLLDNMAVQQVRECAAIARWAGALVEVSGGITLENVREYALAGPDFISVGALTHSASAADISFLLEDVRG